VSNRKPRQAEYRGILSGQRPRRCRAAEERDEIAAFHAEEERDGEPQHALALATERPARREIEGERHDTRGVRARPLGRDIILEDLPHVPRSQEQESETHQEKPHDTAGLAVGVCNIASITDEATRQGEFTKWIDCGDS
jgi:hypothetical protein